MPTIRRNNLSLGDLGAATGQYTKGGSLLAESESIANFRQDPISNAGISCSLHRCIGGDPNAALAFGQRNPEIKISDFYAEVSGAIDGIDGDPSNTFSQSLVESREDVILVQGTIRVVTGSFNFQNTGSYFHKIANRWQNFAKQANSTEIWKITDTDNDTGFSGNTFADYVTFNSASAAEYNAPLNEWDNQGYICGLQFVGPGGSTSHIYNGELSVSFVDVFNYDYRKRNIFEATRAYPTYSQSMVLTLKRKSLGGPGGGS